MLFFEPSKRFLPLTTGLLCSLMACTGSPVKEDSEQHDSLPNTVTELETDSLLLYEDEPEPETADILFVDFFYAFTTNPQYQQQRVVFPLGGGEQDQSRLTLAQWKEQNPFVAQDFYAVIYDHDDDMVIQNDTTIQSVSVEKINLISLQLDHYSFERLQGKWMLTTADQRHVADTPQGHFLQFYSHFANDTLFQQDNISFPLRLVTEPEDDEEEAGTTDLTEEEWPEFRQQMPLPTDMMTVINYGQTAISQNRKVLLMEGLSNGLFVKYKFDCTGGRWKLYEIEF